MDSINKRINSIINSLGMTPYEFSKKMGNSRPDTLYNILNNESSQPSPKTLNKIKINFPGINYTWLLTGEGEMLKNETSKEGEKAKKSEDNFKADKEDIISLKNELALKEERIKFYEEKIKFYKERESNLEDRVVELEKFAEAVRLRSIVQHEIEDTKDEIKKESKKLVIGKSQ